MENLCNNGEPHSGDPCIVCGHESGGIYSVTTDGPVNPYPPKTPPAPPSQREPQWGVGNRADSKAFDHVTLHGVEGDLIFGEHPHTRQDNNQYLRMPDGTIHDFDGFRELIDIEIKSHNYLKESHLSGEEIRKSVVGKVFVDGVCLVEVFGRDPIRMLRRLETLIEKYQEHESQWFRKEEREKLVGRKIWYHDQPATIVRLIEDQNAIMIATEADFVPPKRNDDENDYDYWQDWKKGDHYEIKDDVLSPHIWWWRD